MIHYHGAPITPEEVGGQIFAGRHGLVSFAHPGQIGLVAGVCKSFVLDNGAFSFWKNGKLTNWEEYYAWVETWRFHPGFDWALIPDVIDGGEAENDMLISNWPFGVHVGVPVWHFHESLRRLDWLCNSYPRVALGSSGTFSKVGTPAWWGRMREVMSTVCVDGRPKTKLHGLRMLDPKVFTQLPLASADSSNVARNINLDKKWHGTYTPPNAVCRGILIAQRVEAFSSSPIWEAEGEG